MRGILLFPTTDLDQARAALTTVAEPRDDDWIVPLDGAEHARPGLYLYIADAVSELAGWDAAEVSALTHALGYRPTWYIGCDVSSQVTGTAEVYRTARFLLAQGGVAVDDHTSHLWSAHDIATGRQVDGRQLTP